MPLLYFSVAILLRDAGYDVVAFLLVVTSIFDLIISLAGIFLKLIK